MAQILVNLREEPVQATLENGVAGVGGLQTRELGYSSAALEFSFRTAAGPFVHLPTREKLLLADDAESSGAAGIGYFPASGFVSDTVQEMLDELAAAVSGAGGGPGGAGVAGRFAYWTGADALDDVSFLSVSGSAMVFGGDSEVNLYRSGADMLHTDGGFTAAAQILAASFYAPGFVATDGYLLASQYASIGYSYAFDNSVADGLSLMSILGTVSKNNSNTRRFAGLRLRPLLDAGGSNANTTFDVLEIDPDVSSLTGLTVNLLRLAMGGDEVIRIEADGEWVSSVGTQVFRRENNEGQIILCGGSDTSSADGAMIILGGADDLFNPGELRLFSGNGADATIDLVGNTTLNGFLKLYAESTPADPEAGEVNFYHRNSSVIFQYNDGGTIRYKSLDLAGTGDTWTHSTTPP